MSLNRIDDIKSKLRQVELDTISSNLLIGESEELYNSIKKTATSDKDYLSVLVQP